MPTISIVMPTYNNLDYLPAAIDCILKQSCNDYEFIIVNDGSTDGTKKYLDEFKEKNKGKPNVDKIKIFHKENGGTGSALNLGFSKAIGIWYTWVSSDNVYDENYLYELAQCFHKNPTIDFVYSDFRFIDENDKFMFDIIRPPYIKGCLIGGCCVGICFMYKKELADNAGPYDEVLNTQDYDMWLRMEELGDFLHIAKNLGSYREHSKTVTNSKPSDHLICIERAKKRRKIS